MRSKWNRVHTRERDIITVEVTATTHRKTVEIDSKETERKGNEKKKQKKLLDNKRNQCVTKSVWFVVRD